MTTAQVHYPATQGNSGGATANIKMNRATVYPVDRRNQENGGREQNVSRTRKKLEDGGARRTESAGPEVIQVQVHRSEVGPGKQGNPEIDKQEVTRRGGGGKREVNLKIKGGRWWICGNGGGCPPVPCQRKTENGYRWSGTYVHADVLPSNAGGIGEQQ